MKARKEYLAFPDYLFWLHFSAHSCPSISLLLNTASIYVCYIALQVAGQEQETLHIF